VAKYLSLTKFQNANNNITGSRDYLLFLLTFKMINLIALQCIIVVRYQGAAMLVEELYLAFEKKENESVEVR